ncbi:hypothetical protein TSAR_007110 [Trichomalopsis sarcophagae]|uniref:Uncharacterized protein n=1 Tax=Trichomalopsis sarcophagae TaxID=543379 RepID=A0A232EX09_9HYME|nr:hypothetical protein TSAR_007110 [Trichomalopsis sarcophagae]
MVETKVVGYRMGNSMVTLDLTLNAFFKCKYVPQLLKIICNKKIAMKKSNMRNKYLVFHELVKNPLVESSTQHNLGILCQSIMIYYTKKIWALVIDRPYFMVHFREMQ